MPTFRKLFLRSLNIFSLTTSIFPLDSFRSTVFFLYSSRSKITTTTLSFISQPFNLHLILNSSRDLILPVHISSTSSCFRSLSTLSSENFSLCIRIYKSPTYTSAFFCVSVMSFSNMFIENLPSTSAFKLI